MAFQFDPQSTQPMMALIGAPGAAPVYTVQLLGFSPKERTLFSSVFKLSSTRAMRYVEFEPTQHPHADFYIVDTQDAATLEAFVMVDPDAYGGALFVGHAPVNSDHPVIQRPVRWAEVLLKLDELPRPAHPAQIAALIANGLIQPSQVPGGAPGVPQPTVPAVRSDAGRRAPPSENDIELSQLDQWYDRDKVVTFQTDPAVLVVDPDIAARRYMAAKFIDLKYRVDFAESGEQALQLVATNRYNAVFTETALPGIDGFDLCREIKARADRRRIAIVFVTERGSTIDRVKGAMAGCDAFLAKPIDHDKLVAVLDKFLPNWRLQLPLV